jgi:hypothetical protein
MKKQQLTIAELEALLDQDEETAIVLSAGKVDDYIRCDIKITNEELWERAMMQGRPLQVRVGYK